MKVVNSQRRGSFLVWTLAVQLSLCGQGVYTSDSPKSCKLLSESEQKAFSRLESLSHKNFTADTNGEDSYTYVLQLCGDAGGVPGAAVVQIDNKKKDNKPTVIGMYNNNSTRATEGSAWVMLVYTNSDTYGGNTEMKKVIVMITCNGKMDAGQLNLQLEGREKEHGYFYVFQLDSRAVCPGLQSQLSTGSIILIIGFCLLAVYLIGGFLYQRLIVGAKGMEQFPNYAFWVEVGNLTADGCDFVCRSRSRDEAPAYRGVAAEPLEEEPEERDDHLLPM